jgi:hypothetical protein
MNLLKNLATLASACTLTLAVGVATSTAADAAELNPVLTRLATCEDSWLDWRRDEASMRRFGEQLMAQFKLDEKRRVWVPKGTVTWLGHEVSEITPESVGMGLGFAVLLKTTHQVARPAYERAMGRTLERCENGDGMHSCELKLAEKKTAVMMSPTRKPELGTMLGCYYYYQQ